MRIVREHIPTVDNFTIVPNDWARDERLTRRARGLLVELLSHREGWEASILGLSRMGQEGRDSIRASIHELERYGYLERQQSFDAGGRFTRGTYLLRDPKSPRDGKTTPDSVNGHKRAGGDDDGFSVNGETPSSDNPPSVNPAVKKTISKKTKTLGASEDAPAGYPEDFETFWSIYPKRQGPNPKKPAYSKWKTALKTATADTLIAAVKAYASSELPDDRRMIPQAQNWIGQERWTEQDTTAPDEWLRGCWRTGDTQAVTARTGLIYGGVVWPDDIPTDPADKTRIRLDQARAWITENHNRIIGRITSAV